MAKVYLVWHTHGDDDENSKLLGVFSTQELAESRIERARTAKGFRLYPDGYIVDAYVVDSDQWTEGFVIEWPDGTEHPDLDPN